MILNCTDIVLAIAFIGTVAICGIGIIRGIAYRITRNFWEWFG